MAVEGRKVIEKEDQSTKGESGREVWREGARRIGIEPWERQSKRREGAIGVVRSARQKVAREREEGFVITSPGLDPVNEILLWDTESRCGRDGDGGLGLRLEKDATGRSNPGRTCQMSNEYVSIQKIIMMYL